MAVPEWYQRTVNALTFGGFPGQRGREQRFPPGPPPMSAPPMNNPYRAMGVDPMGNFTGMPSPEVGYEESQNPYLRNPQVGAVAMNDPNSLTPSSYARPSYRQSEVASMDAYKKIQSAGGFNPVKAQAPAASSQAGFYYLDDGQGNVRPYGYASSAPMIPGYTSVLDPNGKQTFGGPPQANTMAQAPFQGEPSNVPLPPLRPGQGTYDQSPSEDNFLTKFLRGNW